MRLDWIAFTCVGVALLGACSIGETTTADGTRAYPDAAAPRIEANRINEIEVLLEAVDVSASGAINGADIGDLDLRRDLIASFVLSGVQSDPSGVETAIRYIGEFTSENSPSDLSDDELQFLRAALDLGAVSPTEFSRIDAALERKLTGWLLPRDEIDALVDLVTAARFLEAS